jgi:hypothetical protein
VREEQLPTWQIKKSRRVIKVSRPKNTASTLPCPERIVFVLCHATAAASETLLAYYGRDLAGALTRRLFEC